MQDRSSQLAKISFFKKRVETNEADDISGLPTIRKCVTGTKRSLWYLNSVTTMSDMQATLTLDGNPDNLYRMNEW